jgi:hypothetical protein
MLYYGVIKNHKHWGRVIIDNYDVIKKKIAILDHLKTKNIQKSLTIVLAPPDAGAYKVADLGGDLTFLDLLGPISV